MSDAPIGGRRAARRGQRGPMLLGALLMLIGLGAPVRAESPMDFRLTSIAGRGGCPGDCASVISAEGEIDNDTADRFLSFLSEHARDHDLRPVVLLESPGGTVVGAMQLGTVFRRIGAAVIVASARAGDGEQTQVVPGACLSACVYAFVGGVRRVVPPVSRLGIHRMVINEHVLSAGGGYDTQQIFGSKDIVSSLAAYTRMMGVDPRMIAYAETIAPEQLHIVTPREIARWRLGRPRL